MLYVGMYGFICVITCVTYMRIVQSVAGSPALTLKLIFCFIYFLADVTPSN